MNKRKSLSSSLKATLILLLLVGIAVLFALGFEKDRAVIDIETETHTQINKPYIEVSPIEDEVVLVGDIVLEWLNDVASATELYQQYSTQGRVYSSKAVILNYSIFDIPQGEIVVSQEVLLSQNSNFKNSKKYELISNQRSIRFDNLYTDKIYYYQITVVLSNEMVVYVKGQFKTADTPRIIMLDGPRNVRDIGGWSTIYGKKIKQGVLYRGSELDGAVSAKYLVSEHDIELLHQFGIKSELDLRYRGTNNVKDMLGSDVNHYYYTFWAYNDCFVKGENALKEVIRDLADAENYPVYLHCSYGADRTGTLCFIIGAILGMSDEDLYKEWELSILCNGGAFYEEMELFLKTISKLEGDTMQEKVENHLLSIGVTKAEIESIREILIEDYVSDYTADSEEIHIDDNDSDYTEDSKQTITFRNKKIVYDGDSIAMGLYGDGGYAQMIAELTKSKMENFSIGGGRLVSSKQEEEFHSVVDNLENLPKDGDLYCFQAGINDYWTYGDLGTFDPNDFTGPLDKTTVCGALETIFRYMKSLDKPVVFVISHKIQGTATHENAMGDTFSDYHDAMVGICKKYGVAYYDAFIESGLDGSNTEHDKLYLTGNSEGKPDGTHPNAEGYKLFYVPQLIGIFEDILK